MTLPADEHPALTALEAAEADAVAEMNALEAAEAAAIAQALETAHGMAVDYLARHGLVA